MPRTVHQHRPKLWLMALVGTGAFLLGAAPVAISHLISARTEKQKSPAIDPWADDPFTSSPALDASDQAAGRIVEQAKVELEQLNRDKAPRGPGECKVGDRLDLQGGWVAGAGGNQFANPVRDLKIVLDGNADERSFLINNIPLHYNSQAGCMGVGTIRPMQAYLSQPLYGGQVEGGRFLIVSVNAGFLAAPSRACFLVVPASEVTCAKE